MFEGLNYIELSGKSYPIRCDILVLEKIQEEYGTIGAFEEKLMTWEPISEEGKNEEDRREEKAENDEEEKKKFRGKLPDAKAVNDALYWFALEGEEAAAEQEARKPILFTRECILRKADINIMDLANKLHDEFFRCFNSKNGKTTQGEAENIKE